MSLDNAYRPPAELSTEVLVVSSPVPTFSADGAALVGSLSRWMGVLGMFYLAIAGLVGLGVLIAFAFDVAVGLFALGIATVVAVAVIAAGVWLREAGGQFNRGVVENDLGLLGVGFASLRKYLVLVGVLGILQFANTLMGVID